MINAMIVTAPMQSRQIKISFNHLGESFKFINPKVKTNPCKYA